MMWKWYRGHCGSDTVKIKQVSYVFINFFIHLKIKPKSVYTDPTGVGHLACDFWIRKDTNPMIYFSYYFPVPGTEEDLLG